MAKRRPNGEGTVMLRRDGRWVAAVYMRQLDGTWVRKYAYTKTYREAAQKRREMVARAHQMSPDSSTKLAGYLDHWLKDYVRLNKTYRTYCQYESTARVYLKPALGRYRLSDLTVGVLQAYFDGLIREHRYSIRKTQIVRTTLSTYPCYEGGAGDTERRSAG